MKIFKTNGWITLVPWRIGWFRPNTMADGDTLRAITGSGYLREADYDLALAKASEQGYGIEVLEVTR